MLLRHVLLLVTFITLVGATFSLPEGLAETSTLESTANGETKRLKAGDALAQRSPSNTQPDSTDPTSSAPVPDSPSTSETASTSETGAITSGTTGSQEFNPDPLTLGSKGDSVRELQAVLKRLGYYYGSVNGVLEKDTQTAVNRFQKEAGLPETPEVDAATLENLKQAERSLASQKQVLATPPAFEADSVPSRDPQTGATEEIPDGSVLLPPTSTATQSQGVGEIGWMGWVMGSLAGVAIAGGLVYGLHRSGNRLATEDADPRLLGIDTIKIFEEGLEESSRAEPSDAEPDLSSHTASLNGKQENGDRRSDRDELGDGFGGRSLASAALTPGSDLPLGLGQSESGQSEPVPLVSVQTDPVQIEQGQSEVPLSEGSQQSVKPDANVSSTPEVPEVLDALAIQSADPDALNETTRILKPSLVDRLINDLHHTDPAKRRGAIWELGQEGDSRAVQPLVDLMLEADSQQRTLILAAIAEISIRTLKPMKRALLTSLQDENSDVRKNAIRDTTRVYDMMAQLSQLLSHTVNDPDPEVQDTAQWALAQLSRLRPNLGDSGSNSPDYDRDQER